VNSRVVAAAIAAALAAAGCGGGAGGPEDSVSAADAAVRERVDAAEERLRTAPNDRAALVQLVRAHYSLAAADTASDTGAFGEEGKRELEAASRAWKRYLATAPERPSAAVADLMTTAYGPLGLDQPANAVESAEIGALARNDVASYLLLVQYATRAGQRRKADLAAEKALELAPPEGRDEIRALIEQAKAAGAERLGPL
jgi:hypothetical protein